MAPGARVEGGGERTPLLSASAGTAARGGDGEGDAASRGAYSAAVSIMDDAEVEAAGARSTARASSASVLETVPRTRAHNEGKSNSRIVMNWTTVALVTCFVGALAITGHATGWDRLKGTDTAPLVTCTAEDFNRLEVVEKTPDAGGFLIDGSGQAQPFSPFQGDANHSFGCGAGHEAWVKTHRLQLPACQMNTVEPGSGGPFASDTRILVAGSAYKMQLTSAIMAHYASDIAHIWGRGDLIYTRIYYY